MPEFLQGVFGMVKAIYSPGFVEPGLKRLVGLTGSAVNGCQYSVAHSAGAARKFAVSNEKLNAIWDYERSDLVTDRERAPINVARYGSQISMSDLDYQHFEQYFDEPEQLEILAVISLFGFLNARNGIALTDIEAPLLNLWNQLDQQKIMSFKK